MSLAWAGQALAFGTIHYDPTGKIVKQNAEHEKITRLAFRDLVMGEDTLSQLAGVSGGVLPGTFGAVGSPDLYKTLTPNAHCDDGDFRDDVGPYPRTQTEAWQNLVDCRKLMFDNLNQAVIEAGRLVNPDLSINYPIPPLTWILSSCTWFGSGRAKCDVLQSVGRAFHAAQDFYSHSNWSDHRLPPEMKARLETPDGLGNTVIADFSNPRMPLQAVPVPGLLTGCFVAIGHGCDGHTQHADLNKDTGAIDRDSFVIGDGTTKRGELYEDKHDPTTPAGDPALIGNFHMAVKLAVEDTIDKWKYFQEQILATYPGPRGYRILCVVRSDYPKDCRNVVTPN